DENNCEVEAVINNVIASIQYTVDSRQLTIYPNPVTDKLNVNRYSLIGTADAEISIYNVMGEIVMAVTPLSLGEGQEGEAIDCRTFPAGVYYLEIDQHEKIYRTK